MADVHHNLSKVKDAIKDGIQKVRDLKEDREDTNAGIAEVRARLAALGIPKKAFDMALQYADMDPDKREGFDIAYALVREVAGLPMQDDLFSAAARKGDDPVPDPNQRPGADATEIEKVISSQDADKKTKGKTVLPSSTGTGTIN